MKYLLAAFALLAGCASPRPIDRTETQAEYAKEEAANQKRSLSRSEIKTKISALGQQIKAIDAQIENQENLVSRYAADPDEAGSEGMAENAKVRVRHLRKEREALVQMREELKNELAGT